MSSHTMRFFSDSGLLGSGEFTVQNRYHAETPSSAPAASTCLSSSPAPASSA
eukprot:CAMPEP_0183803802 /NCGR_PEP_ID=MMETSP0803_2-20130417/33813_1 /TAXON_ID=195967 /ORGANISM="Crustomastix stigmata, Strain CCMP3273" /LENGTH=51 /DNA_ID=CAMNT_0026048545 /DNA_START=23 /DNA_END=175 /DNA_ORIENTATION=+